MQNLIKRIGSSVKYRFAKRTFSSVERLIKKRSKVGDHTFFENSLFPWIKELEDNWQIIREELDNVMETTHIPAFQEVSVAQKNLTQDDKWKTFIMFFYRNQAEENCRRCPETIKLVQKIPGMKTAFFSILSPRKHIPPHRGPYNGVLRFHLGLRVPQDRRNCKIRVGNDFGYWQEGKALIFDDSYEHEVWNDTDEMRVVLFIDFLRPLPRPADLLNRLYIKVIGTADFVKDTMVNLNSVAKRKKRKQQLKVPA